MTACTDAAATETRWVAALRVFEAWMRECRVPSESLAHNPLLDHLLNILMNADTPQQLHIAASDCIIAAICRIEPPVENFTLATKLRDSVCGMMPAFKRCADAEDLDRLHSYSEIICELADAFVPTMVSEPGYELGQLQPLDMALEVCLYPDYSLCAKTFNMW